MIISYHNASVYLVDILRILNCCRQQECKKIRNLFDELMLYVRCILCFIFGD